MLLTITSEGGQWFPEVEEMPGSGGRRDRSATNAEKDQ